MKMLFAMICRGFSSSSLHTCEEDGKSEVYYKFDHDNQLFACLDTKLDMIKAAMIYCKNTDELWLNRVKILFTKKQVPFIGVDIAEFYIMPVLTSINWNAAAGDKVIALNVSSDLFLNWFYLQFTSLGYKVLKVDLLPYNEKNVVEIKNFFSGNDVKKVLVHFDVAARQIQKSLKKNFPSSKIVFSTDKSALRGMMMEKCRSLLGEVNVQFKILTLQNNFVVKLAFNGNTKIVVSLKEGFVLPSRVETWLSKFWIPFIETNFECVKRLICENEEVESGVLDFDEKISNICCSGFYLHLDVDEFQNAELVCSPYHMFPRPDSFQNIFYVVRDYSKKTPAMIVLYVNALFAGVYQNDNYMLLKDWNDDAGKECVMAFTRDSGFADPFVFKEALPYLKTHPNMVVFDIVQIMAISADSIQVDEIWPFSVVKSPKGAVHIVVDSLNQKRISADVAVFMSMFLEKPFFDLGQELGTPLTEVGFFVAGDTSYNQEEVFNIQRCLESASQIHGVRCLFVEV